MYQLLPSMYITHLLSNQLAYLRVTVPQCIDRNAGSEVKILSTLDIPHVATLPLLEYRCRPDIGRDHEWRLLFDEAHAL